MYEAITAGKRQQLQVAVAVAVGRYLRSNGKKTLSGLSTALDCKSVQIRLQHRNLRQKFEANELQSWIKYVGCSICAHSSTKNRRNAES